MIPRIGINGFLLIHIKEIEILSNMLKQEHIWYTEKLPEDTYHKYCYNKYSQNGEDGIIERVLKDLKIANGYCCEFGAGDGVTSSNTRALIERGWASLQIEGSDKLFNELVTNMMNFNNVYCENKFISKESNTENSLNTLLNKYKFPKNFDLLSIDIDSYDNEVWESLVDYTPKIVVIETNSSRDPICEETPYKRGYDKGDDILEILNPCMIQVGSSFKVMIKLGLKKNYIPISYTGNILFVHKDYISNLVSIPYKISDTPDDYLYIYTNLCYSNNTWTSNTLLVYNTAVRNYYYTTKSSIIDKNWVLNEMNTKGQLVWNY